MIAAFFGASSAWGCFDLYVSVHADQPSGDGAPLPTNAWVTLGSDELLLDEVQLRPNRFL